MTTTRWLAALPLFAILAVGPADAAVAIRDEAGMFRPDARAEALERLGDIEKAYGVPVTIETLGTLKGEPIDDAGLERAKKSGSRGIFILIAEEEHSLRVFTAGDVNRVIRRPDREEIQSAFSKHFRQGDYDAGLIAGVGSIEKHLATSNPRGAAAGHGGPGRAQPPNRGRGQTGLGSLLMIGLIIMAVLLGIRLLGNLFGGNRGGYGQPGYGQPGYGGGGGGGFMSGLFGGIGGALAGNWLYDQFRGGSHGTQPTGYDQNAGAPESNFDDPDRSGGWTGGDSGGGDWGSSGGGDWGGGGGDWGGGDGGGGDW